MHQLIELSRALIEHHGYSAIFFLTTAEQFIFPIPVDIFIGMGTSFGLSFKTILLLVLAGALLGSLIGYCLGRFLGHPIALWVFGQKRLDRGEAFIKKWGVWGVILAGLTPIPFKLVTWTSGIFEMPLRKFLLGVIVGRMPRYLISAFAGNWLIHTQFYASENMSAVLLGTLQGITEFLPISSSGHLVIAEHFLKLPPTITQMSLEWFDILLHGGSLLAILLYFRRDWMTLLKEIYQLFAKRTLARDSLLVLLAIGTFPAIFAGLFLGDWMSNTLRTNTTVAIAFMVGAAYFLLAEWKGKHAKNEQPTFTNAVVIGFAQAFALVPGLSRAGTTIATGMLTGLQREFAARFSFLLGGIAILAANLYALISLKNGASLPPLGFTLAGVISAFVVSLLTVHYLMKFLKHHSLRVFSFYLFLMGSLLLTFLN
ncbi:VTT domain-containing protein [Candidatus Peregrinibacteria bacterium]|nr:MAG: VTT domain-containing protein [Candidatus Peregrinibacteria bacterium]